MRARELFRHILLILRKPFYENLWLLISLWFAAIAGVFGVLVEKVNWIYAIECFLLSGYMSYAVVLCIGMIPKAMQKTIMILFLILSGLNILIDVVLVETSGDCFNAEHATLLLGTNGGEAIEFITSYITVKIVLLCSLYILSYIFVIAVSKFLNERRGISVRLMIALSLVLPAMFTNLIRTGSWSQVYLGKVIPLVKYSAPPDLIQYRHSIDVNPILSEGRPNSIIVVIGESFSRSHSSLYGYSKETNPLLSKVDTSSLFVFENVVAAATHTTDAFQLMMTSCDHISISSSLWYTEDTIFDIARSAGYQTCWVSNQSRVGLYDNIVAKFAELCDDTVWAGESARGTYKVDYDDVVLPIVKSKLSDCHQLLFVHLLGSHPNFSDRYPDDYSVWSSSDYDYLPINQRDKIASYDNSVLYNDFIVNSLLEYAEQRSSIVLFFSDHGLDLYISDSEFCGHAKDSDEKSIEAAVEVPLWVFVPNSLQSSFPQLTERIRSSTTKEYNLENVMYTLSDLMGVTTIDGSPIADKSLFAQPIECDE